MKPMKTLALLAIFLLASSCNGACTTHYTVEDGDTCERIVNINVPSEPSDSLLALNPGLDCENLQVGQQLCVAGTVDGGGSSDNSQQEPSSDVDENPTVGVPSDLEPNSSDLAQTPSDEEPTASEQSQNPSEEEPTASEQSQNPSEEEPTANEQSQNPSEEEPTASEQTESPSGGSGSEPSEPVYLATDGTVVTDPFAIEVISAHQYYRNFFDSPQLIWNYTMAGPALSWATLCANNGQIQHSIDYSDPDADILYGENIGFDAGYVYDPVSFKTVPQNYTATYIINQWGNEWNKFVNGSKIYEDSISTTGNAYDVSHFTQVIWKTSTSVGCGKYQNGAYTVLVCRYYPPGNVYDLPIY